MNRPRVPVLLASLALAAACEHPITLPHPAPTMPNGAPHYLGRIELRSRALRHDVQPFSETWARRLAILGVHAQITFDDDLAVVDVFDDRPAPADLPHVAQVLAEPGHWAIDAGRAHWGTAEGALTHWKPPSAECGCTAELRVIYDPSLMRALDGGGPFTLSHDDAATPHRILRSTTEYRVDPNGIKVPIAVHLFLGDPSAQLEEAALGLAGGQLPSVCVVDAVTPRGAKEPR